ncbi:MAG TPA: dihydrolipoyl dehydrogenase [Bacillota bacterium]
MHDLIVIGGGPAGYRAAIRAGRGGLSVLLAEKRFIGGVCLNEGCIPSKTLLYSAKLYEEARNSSKYGVTTGQVTYDQHTVLERKTKVIRTLAAGINRQLREAGVTVASGAAEIEGKSNSGYSVRVGDEVYEAKNLLLATGSEPIIPAIPGVATGLKSGLVLTSRELLDLAQLPESLVIIGAGVIGLEMAAYFNAVGTHVTIIEMLDHIAGNADPEIAAMLLKEYRKQGIDFRLGSKVTALDDGPVRFITDGREEVVSADKVLLSIGRKPAVTDLGLERIGLTLERGAITTDPSCRTELPGVYAAGDVNGRSMLAHTAYREAEVCIDRLLGKEIQMDYGAIPAVIYTRPEAAMVGETEETAAIKGIDYEVAKLSMRYSGRFLAENEGGDGVCKLLIEKHNRKLIGAHLIGSYASEIIYGAAMLIESGRPIQSISEVVFPHPTVSEILRDGLLEAVK